MKDLHNPDYLNHLCQKYGLQPSKQYGQNFLIDETVIDKIIAAAELKPADEILEVGPGFGVLTLALAARVKKVTAFEIEKKLEGYWIEQIKNKKNIELVWGNVLRIHGSQFPIHKYKVVSNLPYQITSVVIRKFLEEKNQPELMVLMVQKEVAERICAKTGDMSLLAVAVQYYSRPEIIAAVGRAAFYPAPKVDSAIIKFTQIHAPKSTAETQKFFKLVKIGFSSRRKILIKNLEPFIGKKNKAKWLEIFAKLGLTEKARAQELSVGQWQELSTYWPV